MDVLDKVRDVRAWCDARRREGARIGFVPTMGFLHEGHISLMRAARERADRLVVSIFVNPTQFGPHEDLARYPRDPEGDAARCLEVGTDLLFLPSVEEMYPAGAQTFVAVEDLSQGLCGVHRPTHFRGVSTVVEKLFNVIGPCVAVFGDKDYQQLQVISRMVCDLLQPVEVVGAPLIREPDGLAMSSRNAYLSPAERQVAPCLYESSCLVRDRIAAGEVLTAGAALDLARTHIEDRMEGADVEARIDYVELRRPITLEPLSATSVVEHGAAVILLAVFLGTTRLIDNLTF